MADAVPVWPRRSFRNFWRWVGSPQSRHPDSLFWYMKKIYGMDRFMRANPSKQWFTRAIHKPYCKWVQSRYYRMFDAYKLGAPCRVKMMSALPRGFLKSTIDCGTTTWAQLENPDFGIRLGAADENLALDLFTPIKAVLEGKDDYSSFTRYYGNWKDDRLMWQRRQLNHAARRNLTKKEPSFAIWYVERGFTGHHPEIAVMDDPVTREKLREEGGTWLEKANVAIMATRPAMPQCSIFHLIGTRYHDDDPIGHYMHQEGVKSWEGHPCNDGEVTISPQGEWEVYFLQVRDPETNESIEPKINTTEDLDVYEASNSIEFWAQMMNQPARGDHMGLDRSQIDEIWVSTEDVPRGDHIIVVDTAFKEMHRMMKGDESVFEDWTIDPRPNKSIYYFNEGYSSRKDRVEDFTKKLVLHIQKVQGRHQRIALITDERSPGKAGTWFHYLRDMCSSHGILCPATLELPRGGTKSKTKRIRIAAGFWADGHIRLVKGAPGVHKLVTQMQSFETARFDDWADAAADLFHPDVHKAIVPFAGNDAGSGRRQIGPDDAELMGDQSTPHENGWSDDYYDTIYTDGSEWQ